MVDNQASSSMLEATGTKDDLNVPHRKTRKISPISHSDERLACPFYRHCPAKSQKYRSCAGPGWSTVHRVKEHILRQHAPPIHCGRCSTLFTTETELHKHLKLPDPCSVDFSNSHAVGFNKKQEKALRKRGRGPADKQWKEMYRILFPLVRDELIPSPYYENNTKEWEKRRRRDLDQMQTYLGLEIPRKVRRRLEQTSFQLPQSLRGQIFRQLIQIVETAHADAFQSYRQQDTNLPMRTDDPDITSCQPSNSDSAQQSQTTGGCGLEAFLEAPTPTTKTEGTHGGLSPSTAGDIFQPFKEVFDFQYDMIPSVSGHDGMGQQHEGTDWMNNEMLDTSFGNFELGL